MNKQDFVKSLKKLQEIVPLKFRTGSKFGDGFLVLPYIDARDCMDRLDEIFGPYRQRKHYEVAGKSYCSVEIRDGEQWIAKSDVGEQTKISKEKGEASDSFKRACVNRGLGRFLYTMPRLYITNDEEKNNKFKITEFTRKKFYNELKEWASKYSIDINKESIYESSDDEPVSPEEKLKTIVDMNEGFLNERKQQIESCTTIDELQQLKRSTKPTNTAVLSLFNKHVQTLQG